jgi:GTP-binding protein YchF
MKIGLLGLPLAGKTTLFNLLTGAGVQTATYAGERASHTGVAKVPDRRVDTLSSLFQPKKTTYARIDIIDIPGLSQGGASEFAGPLQDADALVLIVRGFTNEAMGIVDTPTPVTDLQNVLTELIISDLTIVERRLERLVKNAKAVKAMLGEQEALSKAREALENEQPVSSQDYTPEERLALRNYGLYTEKPMLVVLNTSEEGLSTGDAPGQAELAVYTKEHHMPLLVMCAPLEEEISQLSEDERGVFLEDVGLTDSGVARLAQAAYAHLDLISYFTVGSDEVRAWTITRGTTARKAAGKIHSDIERGFIRAEVVAFDDMIREQTMARLREKGLLRLEGRDYIVADGDIMSFRFNV